MDETTQSTTRVVTFTPNPSIDRTVTLDEPLQRGGVQRALTATEQAAGKGVNVAWVVASSGVPAHAVLPFRDDAYLALLGETSPVGMAVSTPAVARHSRTNTTLTEPDGTTTKVNEPGPRLSDGDLAAAEAELLDAARSAEWVVLSGSLPPGAPADWYARLIRRVRAVGCRIAVDTSDDSLDAVVAALADAPIDLLKPNAEELAQLTGLDLTEPEPGGDVSDIVAAAAALQARGVANVVVTLGGAGAVLVSADGAWRASPPPTEVRSTVGAGDSSVAGFILAHLAGRAPARCLADAVAYGSAAAGLPGTTLPTPTDLSSNAVRVSAVAQEPRPAAPSAVPWQYAPPSSSPATAV